MEFLNRSSTSAFDLSDSIICPNVTYRVSVSAFQCSLRALRLLGGREWLSASSRQQMATEAKTHTQRIQQVACSHSEYSDHLLWEGKQQTSHNAPVPPSCNPWRFETRSSDWRLPRSRYLNRSLCLIASHYFNIIRRTDMPPLEL